MSAPRPQPPRAQRTYLLAIKGPPQFLQTKLFFLSFLSFPQNRFFVSNSMSPLTAMIPLTWLLLGMLLVLLSLWCTQFQCLKRRSASIEGSRKKLDFIRDAPSGVARSNYNVNNSAKVHFRGKFCCIICKSIIPTPVFSFPIV